MSKANIFVSYCQKDHIYADNIDLYFKDRNIKIHRDVRNLSNWESIRDYMETIGDMHYAILIITDNYLKSFNCMYEVLEVMKQKSYEYKIFPVVVETSIYTDTGRINYINYWQEKYNQFKNQISTIDPVNMGTLTKNLKMTQSICSSIEEFLSKVADMNNPSILDINIAIENKLKDQGLLDNKQLTVDNEIEEIDIFSVLGTPRININQEPTDLQKNQFINVSFKDINNLLTQLCSQVKKENNNVEIDVDNVDTRTVIYTFYKDGNYITSLKIFLDNLLGGRETSIGLSCERYSVGSNNSFNAMISAKSQDGELVLYFSFGTFTNQDNKSIESIVRDIWEYYIFPYFKN